MAFGALILPAFLAREIVFVYAAAFVGLYMLAGGGFPRAVIMACLPIVGLVVLGLVAAMLESPTTTSVVRDTWYVAKIIFYILFGYTLCVYYSTPKHLVVIIVIVSVILSIYYIIGFFITPDTGEMTRNQLRETIGRGYFITAAGAALLIFAGWYRFGPLSGLGVFRWLLIAVVVGAVALSQSRTVALAIVFYAVAMIGLLDRRRSFLLVAVPLLLLLLMVTTPLLPGLIGSETAFQILDNVPRGLAEMVTLPHQDLPSINNFWRGYESYRAWRDFYQGAPVQYLIGRGFGREIDLGIRMGLGDGLFTHISIFHSGFSFLIVKTGILGLVLFLMFVATAHFSACRCLTVMQTVETRLWGRLLLGQVLVWVYTMPTVSGPFNPNESGTVGLLYLGIAAGVLSMAEVQRHDAPAERRFATVSGRIG